MTTIIDFNDLSRGTIVDNEFRAEGVTISAQGGSGQAMVFDTSNPTGGDNDLATDNLGNVLIISEDGDQNDPDDNARGGKLFFDFDRPSDVQSLTILDVEETAWIKLFDEDGNLLKQVDVVTGNNGQKVVNLNQDGVARIEVILAGSGAVDNLVFEQPAPEPELDGIVDGTGGDDLIDANYDDDPEGDRIDNNDALLPGESGDDDIVLAGDGDDTVLGGNGNDEIFGEDGDDRLVAGGGRNFLDGGEGNDTLNGGLDNDTIIGGDGDDVVEASRGDDLISGGDGNDDLWAARGDDTVDGGAGNDVIDGGDGDDSLIGGSGNDTIDGGNGQDTIDGASGDPVKVGENLLVNGGLEAGQPDGTFSQGSLDGWTNNGNPIEIWGDGFLGVNAVEGSNFVEIDVENGVDELSQTVSTNPGDTYHLSFSAQQRDDGSNDQIEISFGGEVIATIIPTDDWTEYNFTVTGSADGSDTLTFREVNAQDTTRGPLLDDIQLFLTETDDNSGDDILIGGADEDLIFADGGDTVDGGSGGFDSNPAQNTDFDTLDLTGQGPFFLDNVTPDENGNGTNGTVVFVDDDGVPTGETINFTEIEQILGDEVNRAPIAADDTADTDEDTPVTIDVLGNDEDPDGDPLTVSEASSPDGDVTVNPDGTITFTPDENFNGETTITYTVTDPDGNEDTATVTVTVNPVNDGPDAVDDADSTPEDTPITVDLLANDTDPDGDALTVTNASVPADQGTLVDNGDGTVTFTPALNFTGEATITYTITDPDGEEDTATHTITVTPEDDAPIAADDTADTDEDTPVTIDVLGNDEDPDGDPLTVSEASSPDGDVTVNPDGTITFTPDENFNGETTITYTVTDPDGNEDTATVTVTVNPVNDGPDAVDDTASTPFDTPVMIPVLANDVDVDGDPLTVTEATSPDGTVTINPDGTLTFEPNPGFAGSATINYTISDPDGLTDDAVVAVLVENQPLDGIVEGTDDADLIDVNFTGDPQGDRVDNNDEILPGEGPNDDIILAGGGDDTVIAGEGDDDVDGGAGDDVITTGEGSDEVDGGEGNDVIDTGNGSFLVDAGYPEQGAFPGFPGEEGTPATEDDRDFVDGGAGDDTISTGDDADTIVGGSGEDVIDGGIDDDNIDGGDDDDRIVGGEGNDLIQGGEGDDAIFAGNDPDLGLDFLNIEDDGTNPLGPDLRPDNGRDTVFGGEGNDTIFGADDDDQLFGEEGDDVIDGEIDDDLIDGGVGDDTLIGGQGNDTILGGDDDDDIDGGLDDDELLGDDGNDDLSGAAGDDLLDGGEGDDTLDGGTGEDTLLGGAGDDVIEGGLGDDLVEGGDGADTIDGGDGGNDTLLGGADADVFENVDGGDTVDGGGAGDDFDTLDLTGSAPDNGSLEVTFTGPDSNGNGFDGFVTYFDEDGNEVGERLVFTEIENVIPCFTPGTMIATPRGEMEVEDLKVGDRVITRDNGIQAIRWVGQRAMTGAELETVPHLKPVLIRQGALGMDLPERDMMVSPNHRVLVASDKAELFFEEREVLVAAKHLTGMEGVDIVDVNATTYIHVMFDQHEVILSDGSWTESFQPGDMTLGSMGDEQREEILELFPELRTRAGIDAYTAARRSLKKHEAKLLTQ